MLCPLSARVGRWAFATLSSTHFTPPFPSLHKCSSFVPTSDSSRVGIGRPVRYLFVGKGTCEFMVGAAPSTAALSWPAIIAAADSFSFAFFAVFFRRTSLVANAPALRLGTAPPKNIGVHSQPTQRFSVSTVGPRETTRIPLSNSLQPRLLLGLAFVSYIC